MKTQQYTNQEIEQSLKVLNTSLENLEYQRKSLNEDIREKRRQIEFYENLNSNQTKIF